MSRSKTEEEVREEFLSHIRNLATYWNHVQDDKKEALDGLAFSILSMLDGSGELPAFTISLDPHEDDKQYHIDNNENWYEPNMIINDCQLHELWHER